ncbi:hypothetical protein H4219_002918 [Mycoemilia scoparia]|uniref:Uncharacterized protein n=1 Tax=Mycoemilia scoparia TaxID=417184 RepID=A0A9W8A2R4_9FUNG|nr:hypothetical protein H4219_002918 [Mycoemilia scoparia]
MGPAPSSSSQQQQYYAQLPHEHMFGSSNVSTSNSGGNSNLNAMSFGYSDPAMLASAFPQFPAMTPTGSAVTTTGMTGGGIMDPTTAGAYGYHHQTPQYYQQPMGMMATPSSSSKAIGSRQLGHKNSSNSLTTAKTPSTASSKRTKSSSLLPHSSLYTPKATPKRTTLTAHQQLITLQYFYDVFPDDTYTDEDVFRLSHACNLDFELTKRRLANLNGKQRELRRKLFNSDNTFLDKDVIDWGIVVDILVQSEAISIELGNRIHPTGMSTAQRIVSALALDGNDGDDGKDSGDKDSRSTKRLRIDSDGKSAFSSSSSSSSTDGQDSSSMSLVGYGNAGLLTSPHDDPKTMKRLGKDDNVLAEIHHRELLGVGYTIPSYYVMGQSKKVKEWLDSKRHVVQQWLIEKLGADNAPVLTMQSERPEHHPTTANELLKSELGSAYLDFKAAQRAGMEGGGSGTAAVGTPGTGSSRVAGTNGRIMDSSDGNTVDSNLNSYDSYQNQNPNAITVHAGSSIFVSPNEDFREELQTVLSDLQVVLSHCTLIPLPEDIGTKPQSLESMFNMMYLWLQPKLLDQRSIRSEITMKDPVIRDNSTTLVDQIYQTVVELRQARKLPVGMILSVGAMTLADGQFALLLTLNKTVHHPLYILPGVSPKSAQPKPPHSSAKRKRGRSGGSADANEDDVLSQALSARLDSWLDDWLLVQDRAHFRLKSDMVFIRRGSYMSACNPRPQNGSDDNSDSSNINDDSNSPTSSIRSEMARLGIINPVHHEATIQPTKDQAKYLSKMNLDMVGRPWKHLSGNSSSSTDSTSSGSESRSSSSTSTIVYHFKRTVTLDAIAGQVDDSEFASVDFSALPATPTKSRSKACSPKNSRAMSMLSPNPTPSSVVDSVLMAGSSVNSNSISSSSNTGGFDVNAEWDDLATPLSDEQANSTTQQDSLLATTSAALELSNNCIIDALGSWKDTWSGLIGESSSFDPGSLSLGFDNGYQDMVSSSTDSASVVSTVDPSVLANLQDTFDQISKQTDSVTITATPVVNADENGVQPKVSSTPGADTSAKKTRSRGTRSPPASAFRPYNANNKSGSLSIMQNGIPAYRSMSTSESELNSMLSSSLSQIPAKRVASLNNVSMSSPSLSLGASGSATNPDMLADSIYQQQQQQQQQNTEMLSMLNSQFFDTSSLFDIFNSTSENFGKGNGVSGGNKNEMFKHIPTSDNPFVSMDLLNSGSIAGATTNNGWNGYLG